MDVLELKLDVERLEQHIKQSKKALKNLVHELQKKCDHSSDTLRECDSEPMEYFDTMPPMRVCMICGATEEGWFGGYEELTSKETVPKIPRNDLYKLRR